jgi:hypothetical protein
MMSNIWSHCPTQIKTSNSDCHTSHLQNSTPDQSEEQLMDSVFREFNLFLSNVTKYLLTENYSDKFKNTIAKTTRRISLFINRECEEFGMNTKIYEALMSYSKSNKMKYNSLQCQGNFKFEGRNTPLSIIAQHLRTHLSAKSQLNFSSSHLSDWMQTIQTELEAH